MTAISRYADHTSAPSPPADAADIPLHVDDIVQFTLCKGDRQHFGRIDAMSSSGQMLKVQVWVGYWHWVFDHECALYICAAAVDVCGVSWKAICKEATRREFEANGELGEWRG